MIDNYLAYILLALTITIVPGPAVLLTIKNSVSYGWKMALGNIMGNFVAMVMLATLSAIGLGALLIASSALFTVIKIMGCLYLIYLGVRIWREAIIEGIGQPYVQRRKLATFKEGLWVGLSNPKAIVFFSALFPQFINPGRELLPQFVTLILTIEGISTLVLIGYALLAVSATPFLKQRKISVWFNKLTGGIFIGLGASLLYRN